MKKTVKHQIDNMMGLIEEAQIEIIKFIEVGDIDTALGLLGNCQECAISIGNTIGESEGEEHLTIGVLNEYCEKVYQVYEGLLNGTDINPKKISKFLTKTYYTVKGSIVADIKVRKEAVFFPYKASMWDSLESIYLAAKENPECDVYVVPIPYFDKNPDGTMKERHYEGNMYPDYVDVTFYKDYKIEEHEPDMAFIHNPYDSTNFVTTIAPEYYSDKLKKYVKCLVYVPYYATAGGMSDAQGFCLAYQNADYIVIQSEKYKGFFHPSIPDGKFLPFGSPKFDNVIKKCLNPPESPREWKEMMEGKKVYFYNTSLQGMLFNTQGFFDKMRYVFDTFKRYPDACLLWRPHPLFESTLDSMRPAFRPVYDALKKEFIENKLGIFDTTPYIEDTIAQCDYYLGDTATSVTSLFGVAGKPQFFFNNNVSTLPEENDWRGQILNLWFNYEADDRWIITHGNRLWHSEKNDYNYRYYCELNKYTGGNYYATAKQVGDKVFIFPNCARDIRVLDLKSEIIRSIPLKNDITKSWAFCGYWFNDEYAFLMPNNYPDLVRFDYKTEEIVYISGVRDLFATDYEGERVFGGSCLWKDYLVMASPVNGSVLFLNIKKMQAEVLQVNAMNGKGIIVIIPHGDELWLLPGRGREVCRWNPVTMEARIYGNVPEDFECIEWPNNYVSDKRPFGMMAFVGEDEAVISPAFGNMYLLLDTKTGRMQEWKLPDGISGKLRSDTGYMVASGMGGFFYKGQSEEKYRLWDAPVRKMFEIDFDKNTANEIPIDFDKNEIIDKAHGFGRFSEWLMYGCNEDCFNTLEDLLSNNLKGKPFSREEQLEAYMGINASPDGDCGQKVFDYVLKQVDKK